MALGKIRPLPSQLQQIAIDELNEVPERILDDIQELKTWISQQPHLKARTDDQFLLSFLRGCKYSLERAKSKIDKFHSLRAKFPDLFCAGFNKMDRVLEVLRLGPILYFPNPLNDNGPRIGMFRPKASAADKYSVSEVMMVFQLMQEILLIEDDHAVVNGIIHIMDFSNISIVHFFQITPSLMKNMILWSEQAVPLRMKGNHFIHTPRIFEPVFNMIKRLLSKKLQDRLYAHGNKMELLYAHVPKKYLPKDYDGDNGSLEEIIKEWERRFIDFRDYFKESESYGTDESLRPGKPKWYSRIFGFN